MRILFVINGLNRGGAERMLLRLLGSSALSDDELTVVSLLRPGDLSDQVAALGHKVIHLGAGKSPLGFIRLFGLIRIIRTVKPDVIHSWLYQSDLLTGICAVLLGFKPVIWSIRVQGITASSHNKLLTRLCVKACAVLSSSLPAAIISNAHVSKKSHVAAGYDDRKITVIPNGIDVGSFLPSAEKGWNLRHSLGIAEKAAVVLLVSRYDVQKNLHGFFGIAGRIQAAVPQVEFVLCGRGMETSNVGLAEMIAKAEIGRRVHLLGIREDICDVLNAGDVLVSASNEEGWPNVVGEAMACGVPCVATDVGDTALIVGQAGRIVQPGNMQEMADQIISILRLDDKDRAILSKHARRRIVENFEIGHVAEQFHKLYRSVALNCRRPN